MADGFQISAEDQGLLAALDRLGTDVERYTMPAALATAKAVQREGKARIAKRTGATAAGVEVREDYKREGYVILTNDTITPGSRTLQAGTARGMRPSAARKWASRRYEQGLHVGLYLEQGTQRGQPRSHTSAARPWLGPAADVEQGPHGRRMRQAIQDAMDAAGFGGN
jgi:hypothetical protein